MADVEKVVLKPIEYVDGVPVEGQSRIDWIQNGEQFGGATSPVTNEGELNRAGVKIQRNVATAFDNIRLTSLTVNELVDLVNIHEQIVNPAGDGSNLFDRMSDAEFKINTHENSIQSLIQSDINIGIDINTIRSDIGNVNPDKTYRTVRDELYNIKGILGNYKDFDQDGNADLSAIGRGVKGQVERNLKSITEHDIRIGSLEKWWDGKTPDVLIQDVAKLRSEIGSTPTEESVYDRLDGIEQTISSEVGLTTSVDKLNSAVNVIGFPMSYTDLTGSQHTVTGLWEYTYQLRADAARNHDAIVLNTNTINGLTQSLGQKTDDQNADTAWGEINELKQRSLYLEGVVGTTETDGLQGMVKTIDDREQYHYDRLDGIAQNLSTTVFNEHATKIAELNTEVLGQTPNLRTMVRGYPDGTDEFEVYGVYEAARHIYDEMYTPYKQGGGNVLNPETKTESATFVRIYDSVGDQWVWADLNGRDYILTVGKSVKSNSGSVGISFSDNGDGTENVVIGDTDTGIELKGVVEQINISSSGSVAFDSESVLSKTSTETVVGSGKEVHLKVETPDSAKVVVGGDTFTLITTDNATRLLDLQDPRTGVDMNQGETLKSAGYVLISRDQNKVLIGNELDKVGFSGLLDSETFAEGSVVKFKFNGTEYEGIKLTESGLTLGSGNIGIGLRLNNDDVNSLKAIGATQSYTIWHDGNDAPIDGAFYARRNGNWVGFNPGGDGGIGDEAPDNGLQYLRVSEGGVGRWDLIGSKTIAMAADQKITGDVSGETIDLIKFASDKTIQIGVASSSTYLNGVVNQFTSRSGFIMDDGKNGFSYNNSTFSIGDVSTTNILLGSTRVRVGSNDYDLWHNGTDAAADGKFYARRNGQWQMVFNGVNPDESVNINIPSAYRIAEQNVAAVRMVGPDYVVSLAQAGEWTEILGNVMPFNLQQTSVNQITSIGATTTTGSHINVIGASHDFAKQDHVVVGDSTVRLELVGSEGYLNGHRVTTTADDAPSDNAKYVRRNNTWDRAYYYGDFSVDAPSSPKEGDLFFEFIN